MLILPGDAAGVQGGAAGADWGQGNASSTHVCNGYAEVIVQRDLPPHRSHCPCPLHPIIISINIMAEDRRTDDP